MSTELAPKKRVCAGHTASTRRFLGQVDTAVASVLLDVNKITQLKRSLEDKLKALNVLDEEILTLTPKDAIEGEIVQADEVRELIYIALSRLELAHKPLPVPTVRTKRPSDPLVTEPPVGPTDPAAEEAHDLTTEAHARGTKVKLPKITMDPIADHMMDPIPDNMTDLILDNADLSNATKHPILLPCSHHYSGLVVQDAHIRVCHNGVKETLTEV